MKSISAILLGGCLAATTLTGCSSKGPGNAIDVKPLGDHAEVFVRALSTAPEYQEKLGNLMTVELIGSSDSQQKFNFTNTTIRRESRQFRLHGTEGTIDVELSLTAKNNRPWVVEDMKITEPDV